MPPLAIEIAFAKRAIGVLRSIFKTRKVLRQERRDLETLLAEVAANLDAVRTAVRGDVAVNRWGRLGQLLETCAWRRLCYQLTSLVDGPLVSADVAEELDALADDFERARVKTLFSSDWEPRLLAVAFALRETLARHPRRCWNCLLLPRPAAAALPALDTNVITPRTAVELQRRVLGQLAESQRASNVSPTKAEAEAKGREIAIQGKTEHKIQNKVGRIAERNSYGPDPFPPRG
jgi:Uncharacterized protein conserved in bacteria (DUF2188)